MNEEIFKDRTKQLALRVVDFVGKLPPGKTTDIIGRQLLRAGTSVGANYRAACRAKSRPDLISKLGTVEEEADETAYWLEILTDAKLVRASDSAPLLQEANEILAMIVASIKTLRDRS
ncbi:MAG: four helix bundle protein [Verrucomicrobia bacterium]|nr:four helix bundle protein [Verrucomicrobiota bacterium]